MKHLLAIILISICAINISISQITNDNSMFFVQPGAIVYAQDYVLNKNNGVFDNSGEIYFQGDWINNGGNTGLINASPGRVIMDGGNQTISGTDVTEFYNLRLNGGATVKSLDINTITTNELDLIDAELQTKDNIMFFTNPNPDSIIWNNGYVASSNLGGYLSRETDRVFPYMFPVGANNIANTYRAVEITPSSGNSNSYAVRLANLNPTNDITGTSATGATGGFDVDTKNILLDKINTRFYHNITRLTGNDDAEANVYYFTSDGDFTLMAQWLNGTSQWEPTAFTNTSNSGFANIGSPNMISSISSLNNFNYDVFALSNESRTVKIPQFISPDGNDKNDVLIIDNILYYPNNKLQIFNRYGNLVYEKENYSNDWDGSSNISKGVNVSLLKGDNTLPSGTYYYVLNLGVDQIEPYVGYIQIRK